jgi:hypothetical protein
MKLYTDCHNFLEAEKFLAFFGCLVERIHPGWENDILPEMVKKLSLRN